MQFTVEAGIVPVSGKRGRKPTEFPLDQMTDVGMSFLISCDPTSKKDVESWRRKVLVAKKRFAEEYGDGYEFTTAVVNSEQHGSGLRVWRSK
jgi:hypothetical protein